MKKNGCITVFFIIILFCGCKSNDNFFTNNIFVISDPKITNTTTGEKITNDSINGISSLICFNQYLMAITPKANNVFNVLTFDGKVISQFGTIGRANDEIMNSQFNGQTMVIDGHECIWINDVSKIRMILIDVDESIKQNKIVIIKEIKLPPMAVYSFNVNDSILLSEQFTEKNYLLIRHNILSKDNYTEVMYNNDSENAFSLYKSIWRLSPNKDILIGAMQSTNQINYYSVYSKERRSVVIGESKTNKNELINSETGLERKTYFCDIEITKKNVYALYMNQDYNDSFEKSQPQYLIIFDLEGNLNQMILLQEYIIDITISPDGKYLYGRTSNDDIYRYKL